MLCYYSSSGIMEPPAHEDPGVGDRPLGVIALATAAVRSISSFLHHGLIQTYSRLNVPTKCTPLEISLPQVSNSTPNSGARQLHGSWTTSSTTSAKSIGILFLVHSIPPLRVPSRKRPSATVFQWMWMNACHSRFLTLPPLLVTIDYPVLLCT